MPCCELLFMVDAKSDAAARRAANAAWKALNSTPGLSTTGCNGRLERATADQSPWIRQTGGTLPHSASGLERPPQDQPLTPGASRSGRPPSSSDVDRLVHAPERPGDDVRELHNS